MILKEQKIHQIEKKKNTKHHFEEQIILYKIT